MENKTGSGLWSGSEAIMRCLDSTQQPTLGLPLHW